MSETCFACGAIVPRVEGPTHRYLKGSAGCWAVYGEVLASEFGDAGFYAVHGLTVDAYALQHPGRPSPQTIQSAAVHLISLHLILTRGDDAARSAAVRRRTKDRLASRFQWLEPPGPPGDVRVADVVGATDAAQHRARVERWAASVWEAWADHHETVRGWIERLYEE